MRHLWQEWSIPMGREVGGPEIEPVTWVLKDK